MNRTTWRFRSPLKAKKIEEILKINKKNFKEGSLKRLIQRGEETTNIDLSRLYVTNQNRWALILQDVSQNIEMLLDAVVNTKTGNSEEDKEDIEDYDFQHLHSGSFRNDYRIVFKELLHLQLEYDRVSEGTIVRNDDKLKQAVTNGRRKNRIGSHLKKFLLDRSVSKHNVETVESESKSESKTESNLETEPLQNNQESNFSMEVMPADPKNKIIEETPESEIPPKNSLKKKIKKKEVTSSYFTSVNPFNMIRNEEENAVIKEIEPKHSKRKIEQESRRNSNDRKNNKQKKKKKQILNST